MKIIAFDPGKITSYAIFDTAMPYDVTIGEVDEIGVGRLRRPCGLHVARLAEGCDTGIVEEVGARSGQGVSSMFTFGLCTAVPLTVLAALAIPCETVTPPTWKKASRITAENEEGKTQARLYATQLWPQHKDILKVKKNHGMADAALMARWFFLKGPGRDAATAETVEVLSAA